MERAVGAVWAAAAGAGKAAGRGGRRGRAGGRRRWMRRTRRRRWPKRGRGTSSRRVAGTGGAGALHFARNNARSDALVRTDAACVARRMTTRLGAATRSGGRATDAGVSELERMKNATVACRCARMVRLQPHPAPPPPPLLPAAPPPSLGTPFCAPSSPAPGVPGNSTPRNDSRSTPQTP